MLLALPDSAQEFMKLSWAEIEPFYRMLADAPLNEETKYDWIASWSRLSELYAESYKRLYVATTVDTTDAEAEKRLYDFLDNIQPNAMKAENELQKKLVESGVEIEDFDVPLRHIRADIAIFREENLPIFIELDKLSNEYDKIIGAQTVMWEGEELTLTELGAVLEEPDRQKRERAWKLMMERTLQDREQLNELWQKLLERRVQVAKNAGFDSYRDYTWQRMGRFDYTPEDCITFQNAIEEVVVPAAQKIVERRLAKMGADTFRPWDQYADPLGRPALKAFSEVQELETRTSSIFHRIDSVLGGYFDAMRADGLLDLDNRKGKAPGGYCESFDAIRKPFIFMNAVGIHEDVQTMLHEGGHAFHVYESAPLPYFQQMDPPMEFCEVASTAMEFIGGPYLTEFYDSATVSRVRTDFLEGALMFWAYMAVVDAFQHWVYANPGEAMNPANCDAKWRELERRLRPFYDWSGHEAAEATGWQRKLHIFQAPFYYVEYGLAQLGAVQVWKNALSDQAQAVANYRKALALGGIRPLPELFETAGARFAFDAQTLGEAVDLMLMTVDALSNGAH